MRKLFTLFAAALMSVSMFGKLVQQDISMAAADWGWGYNSQVVNEGDLEKEKVPVTYPYAVRYADEVEYPYLKVGDRLAEGTKLIGDDTLKIKFKASRHKTAGTLASSDLEINLAQFDSIGALGLIGGGFGQLNPVNAAGENGIEWEVVGIGTGPLCTGPLELVGVGYPYALNYVDEVACIDVKAGDSISAGAKINGVGYIRFIGGSYKLNGVLQNDDSEVLEIVDYPYFGYPYCNANGEFVVGDKVFTSCDPAGNALTQWLCYETGPLETGPLGTGPLGTGPLAFKGTGPLAPAVEREVTKVGFNFPTADCPADNNIQMAGTFAEGTMNMEKIIATGWFVSYDFVNAATDETFKFRDATNNDMVLCKFIPANGAEEGKWVQAIFKFGDYWTDDSWHGTPCKYIELDVSDASQYAWKQGMPEPDPESAIEHISADVKAVKVVRDGQVYILRGDKTFNILGAEVK